MLNSFFPNLPALIHAPTGMFKQFFLFEILLNRKTTIFLSVIFKLSALVLQVKLISKAKKTKPQFLFLFYFI